MKNLKKDNKGFTIIEVLIVLAIAGLIMLVVFLAVPALQRNARNTQRKNDVSAVLGSISEFTNNNGGALPIVSGPFNTEFANANPKLGFYVTANVTYNYSAAVRAAAPAWPLTNDTIVVYNNLKCGATPTTAPAFAGTNVRNVVALFTVEGSTTNVNQCQEL